MPKYIHKETGHQVNLMHQDILISGKKHVIVEQPGQRVVSKPQKKFFKDYEADKIRVFMNLNNELGKDKCSVVLLSHQAFWLDSFKTKEQAEAYISSNSQLKCVKFIDTRSGE